MHPRKLVAVNDDPRHCHRAALRLLGFRWQGKEELRSKLLLRGYSDAVITETLEHLEAQRWLDDVRYAATAAREKLRKGAGRLRIERELVASGIDAKIARSVLDTLLEEAGSDAERKNLLRMARRKLRILAARVPDPLANDGARKKLTVYLLNQGYDYGAVETALSDLATEAREREANENDE